MGELGFRGEARKGVGWVGILDDFDEFVREGVGFKTEKGTGLLAFLWIM